MLKTILVLPDGTQLSSGSPTGNAVASCAITQSVNDRTQLQLGSVCAAMAEISLITPDGAQPIRAGQELTIYQDDGATRRKVGIFIAEKPVRTGSHTMSVTGYDRVVRLDRDLTDWLCQLTEWPYSLYRLAQLVCSACGLELTNTQLPNGSHMVQKFTARGVTGRQLLQWIGQVAGRFCRATADGALEFGWYTPALQGITPTGKPLEYHYSDATLRLPDSAMTVTAEAGIVTARSENFVLRPSGDTVTVTGGSFCFAGGLSFGDYQVAPIEKVQLQQTREDVGTVWPGTAEAVNTYRITGNPLLTATTASDLQPVAQRLYEQLKAVTYTPCKVHVPATARIEAGQILPITDRNGRSLQMYVMSRKQTGQRVVLECTGSPSRDSVEAVNEASYKTLAGNVLELRADVEGLRAENRSADGRLGSLELTVNGMTWQVQGQSQLTTGLQTRLTQLSQRAEELLLSVQSIQEKGADKVTTATGYTFNEQGLTIRRGDQTMENRLDNTGMYVDRNGLPLLQANSDGVKAVDVQVENYLVLGANARLEDYGANRTACFYIGG